MAVQWQEGDLLLKVSECPLFFLLLFPRLRLHLLVNINSKLPVRTGDSEEMSQFSSKIVCRCKESALSSEKKLITFTIVGPVSCFLDKVPAVS